MHVFYKVTELQVFYVKLLRIKLENKCDEIHIITDSIYKGLEIREEDVLMPPELEDLLEKIKNSQSPLSPEINQLISNGILIQIILLLSKRSQSLDGLITEWAPSRALMIYIVDSLERLRIQGGWEKFYNGSISETVNRIYDNFILFGNLKNFFHEKDIKDYKEVLLKVMKSLSDIHFIFSLDESLDLVSFNS